jgi:hypothetical protein
VTLTVRLDPGRVFRYLVLAVAVLLALNAVGVVLGYALRDNPYAYRVIHLDREVSVGTWFAQTNLLFVAALLALIGAARRQAGDRWAPYWIALALVALYASIDEGSTLHEQTTALLRRLVGWTGSVYGPPWVIVGSVVVLAVLAFFLRFLLHLPARTRSLFILGAALTVAGAVVMEIVSVEYAAWRPRGIHSYGYQTLAAVEEGLEKVGVCVLVFALLDYMRRHTAIVITSEPPGEAVTPGVPPTPAAVAREPVAGPARPPSPPAR